MSSPAADPLVLNLDLQGLTLAGRPVLGPLALRLRPGETLVLTGPSGIGKTSLLRVLAGLETRWVGQLDLPGRRAMVFQEPTLLPWRNLLDNLRLTTGLSAPAAEQALEEVGLRQLAHQFPGHLSLGQQRRLSLARAFAMAPDVLLMDEPFVSLDRVLWEEMMALFESLRRNHPVATVLVTHSEAEARRLGTRILRLGGHPAQIVGDSA